MKNERGERVSSEERAEILANYFERTQWVVRPTNISHASELIGPELCIDQTGITEAEIISAAQSLKPNRAAGSDDVPPEFWKTIAAPGTAASRWALAFCRRCWETASVPDARHESIVVAIFKKRDAASLKMIV